MSKRISLIRKILNSQEILFLGIFSFLTRFFNLSFPSKVVFDETHFGLYATKYFSHQYYFDIHPPLGKIFLAIAGFFGGVKNGFNFEGGAPYGDFNYLALRFLPALFGSFLVILIYFFAKELGFSKRVAFLSGFLVLFDNALIVQSRFILLDIFLVFFIFLSIYLFIFSRRFTPFSLKWYIISLFCGLSLGVAISIKLTGIGVLGIIWFLIILQDHFFSKKKKEILTIFAVFFLVPFLAYFLIFSLHFYLLPNSCEANCGSILEKNISASKNPNVFYDWKKLPDGNLFFKFFYVNKTILFHDFFNEDSHPYQSDWWSWPLMLRPVVYSPEKINGKNFFIYLLGNPFIWWSALIGIVGYLYLIIRNFILKFTMKIPEVFYSKNILILIIGYFIYFLPFATIKRFMLIYHYLPALIFSIILLSIFFEGIIEMIFGPSQNDKILFKNKKANIIFFGFLLIIFLSFLFFSPLTYGFPMTDQQFQERMWLDIWKI